MASPFKKKSPLNAYKYSLTSQYANPKEVIQPIVEAEAAKAIGDASKKVLGVYSKIEADKLAKTASDEAGNLKHQRAMEVKWGKGNTGPAVKPASHEENMSNFGLTGFKKIQAERDAKDFMNRDFGGNKDPNSLVNIGRAGRTSNSSKVNNKNKVPQTFRGGIKTGKNVGFISNQESSGETKERSMAMMKGSPNKLIGDTMDPYGQINPEAVQTNQAQNDLGAQPIISADSLQPSARDIDVSATLNPYASPGADFNPSSKIKAQDIFGSPMQRQGLMNVGSPAHDKGHPNDYEGHTHRKKGGSYKEGDYMDETDMETSYPKLHTQDVGEIKRDKKSQFMVSKNEDYNPTKIDTIRPLKGKEFKMGWGDAERNISTNPKYKKSK